MAYKFQLGTSRLSGSATFKGDIESQGNLKGVDISGSSTLKVDGSAATIQTDLGTFSLGDGNKVDLRDSTNSKITAELNGGSEYPRVYFFASGNVNNIIKLENNSSNDYMLQILNNANNVGWNFNKEDSGDVGHISGSGNLEVKGNVTIAGDAEVNGSLTVDGATVALNSTVEFEDGILQVSGNAGDEPSSRLTGYIFGRADHADGGLVIYNSGSLVNAEKHIAILHGDETPAAIKVNKLFGDGSNLGNIASTTRYDINEISASFTVPQQNLVKSKTNIITNAPDTANHKVVLPQTGSLAAGDVIKVKLQATADEASYLTIEPSATDNATIDGENNIKLMSPSASVEFVYLGDPSDEGLFAIF